MSYDSGEELIEAVILDCASFNTTNVKRGDWLVLNQGKSDHYIILRPGAFNLEWVTSDTYFANWTTVCEVWQQYVDDAETRTNLYGYVQEVIAQVLTYKTLGDTANTIIDSTISGAEAPLEMWTREGGPAWLKWELNINWQEQATVTFS